MEREFLSFVYDRLENMDWASLKQEIGNRSVYIWGADEKGENIQKICKRHGIEINGFLDSNKDIQSEWIVSPARILNEGAENCYVIVSMLLKYRKQILSDFEENNFGKTDFFYPCDEWKYLETEWKYSTNEEYLENVRYGKKVFDGLDKEKFYFLLAGGHIGDLILGLSFLYAIKKKMRLKRLYVISNQRYKGLASLYKEDIEEIIILGDDDIEALRAYVCSDLKNTYNIIGAGWEFVPIERSVPFPIAQVMYKCRHLGLDYDVKSKYINSHTETDRGFQDYIEKTNIRKHESVILIPYAQTATTLPVCFWENLASRLSEQYSVYTNIGSNEEPIKGTEPIYIPFEYVVKTINYAGGAVSVRCGLTDVLALGKCNCVVLYAIYNQIDLNYADVNSLYINGKESILYKKAIYIDGNKIDNTVVENILDKLEGGS